MKDNINISINKPCGQNFENFQSTDKGGYCNSCKKEVIDFRNLTDKEIGVFFNKNQNKTCGVFLEKQLKSYSGNQLAFHEGHLVIRNHLFPPGFKSICFY